MAISYRVRLRAFLGRKSTGPASEVLKEIHRSLAKGGLSFQVRGHLQVQILGIWLGSSAL